VIRRPAPPSECAVFRDPKKENLAYVDGMSPVWLSASVLRFTK
jgi:hypothetical protein